MKNWLEKIERVGNRLPHPVMLFVWLCALVMGLSALGSLLGWQITHPLSAKVVSAQSLLSQNGLAFVLGSAIKNFVEFAPVGSVLVAMLGIGIAEKSGLLGCLLRAVVIAAPQKMLGFFVVLAGVLSSVAADAGYVVLIPLAALLFKSAGRNPLIGLAAGFAGVSGGYSANLLITPNDAILAGITTEAIKLVQANGSITVTANHFFKMASGIMIAGVGALVTAYLEKLYPVKTTETIQRLQADEKYALKNVGIFMLFALALLLWLFLADNSPLQTPGKPLTQSTVFARSIVVLITVLAAIAGIVFGYSIKTFRRHHDVVLAAEEAMSTMGAYLVLMFFAAQFVAYFNWSNLGIISSMAGAQWLQQIDWPPSILVVVLILLVSLINLLIGSSSAAWALLAPVFVPMLMLVGISPELTQAAYRIGDSATNIITPLMPYFGIVVAFAQRHDSNAGIGTLMALMLPFAMAFMASWIVLLMLWMALDLPLGF
jgi:aminobenzoyl-glutamate transport protein